MLGDEVLIHAGLCRRRAVAASGSFKLRETALVSVVEQLAAQATPGERLMPAAGRRRASKAEAGMRSSPTSSSGTRCSRSSSTWSIVLVGWRALTTLPVQQYPQIESSSVVITTVYNGASAETVRGFLTTPIERVVSAISGVDYIESTSRAGVSTVTVRLKLNHSSTAALAEVTARLQQVRSELPAEAEPPVVEVQRADRPYASFYLELHVATSAACPRITDWLAAHAAAAARDARGRAARDASKAAARSRCASGSTPTASPR